MTPAPLPPRVAWFANGFRRHYAAGHVRKHFHAVRLARGSATIPPAELPVLVVMNHPSWWDPMICTVLSNRFGDDRVHYAAVDAAMAAKYGFFKWLGFFGVDTETLRGAAAFLRTGVAILSAPNRALWVTAQGRFADVRERPLNLRSGVGHLAARMPTGVILPIAFEYAFWSERTPEALIRIGEPLDVIAYPGLSGKEWTQRIETALTATLDALNADAISRDPARFETILAGKSGTGGAYDFWRRARALATFRRYRPEHMADGGGS